MATSAKTTLQVVAGSYCVLTVALILKILLLGPGDLPEAARAYLSWYYQQPLSGLERAIGWTAMAASVVSIISALGLIFRGRWARPLFVACLVVLVFAELLLDLPVLKTPFEYFADSLLGVLAGTIVALAYWSEVANEFRTQAT